MNSTDFVLAALLALVCGSGAQLTSGYSSGGWIVNLGVGFLGALAGVFLSRQLDARVIYDLHIGGTDFPIIYALLGCVFFLAAIGFMIKPSRR